MAIQTEYLLTILKTPKFGQVSVKYINNNIEHKIGSVQELYDSIIELKKKNGRLPEPTIEDLIRSNNEANRILENSANQRIKVLSCNDALYPHKLKRLDDYPVIFYIKGDIHSINYDYSVAIIGTRQPSDFGFRAGRKISGIFAEHEFSIISGLAIGCDTAGHLGAVEKNKPTVAVLASGIDIIYPKENKLLAERILETGGALMSEYELGFKPQPQTFVHRDRLQTALSDGLIVLETDIKGGTMHAVNAAKRLNVPIACLSGHPAQYNGFDKIRGNTMLIEGGASSLGSPEQIDQFMVRLNPNIKGDELTPQNESISERIFIETKSAISSNSGNAVDEMVIDKKVQTLPSQIEKTKEMQNLIEEAEIRNNVENSLINSKELVEIKLKLNELSHQISDLAHMQIETNKLLTNILANLISKEKPSKKSSSNQSKLL